MAKKAGQSKRPTVSKLKARADAEFSKYVRYRDASYKRGDWYANCVTCGVEKPVKQLQAGHFVSRRVNALRFEETNVHAQCTGCNMFKHGEQYLYAKEIDLRYGDGTADALMARRHETHKFTIPELEEIIKDAKTYVKHCLDNPENYAT